jgi:hypothetical protein
MKLAILSVAILTALVTRSATAEGPADEHFSATTLDLSGHGEAQQPPDMAMIDLGVQTDAATAAGAMRDNARTMARVIGALRASGVAPSQIATANINLWPRYDGAAGRQPAVTGYQVTDRIRVSLTDLGRVGPTLDAAVDAGANQAGQVGFGLKDRERAETAARLTAIKAMEDKAAVMASAAGYRIKRLVNMTETVSQVGPPRMSVPIAIPVSVRVGAPTPIENGDWTVSVDVRGEFELSR